MSNGINKLTCTECGAQVDSYLLVQHMKTAHDMVPAANAQRRTAAPQAKGGKGKVVAGVVVALVVLLASFMLFFQPEEDDSPDQGFEDTEDEPDIVELPPDDDNNNGGGGNPDNGTDEEPEPITAVQIPTSDVTTDAKWYPYDYENIEIRFFAVASNDGEIHVAFDACDVCYEEKLGYRQENIQMVCNNCGQSFFIKRIGTDNEEGGCWPSYLPMTIEDDNVIILISDIEGKSWMFE